MTDYLETDRSITASNESQLETGTRNEVGESATGRAQWPRLSRLLPLPPPVLLPCVPTHPYVLLAPNSASAAATPEQSLEEEACESPPHNASHLKHIEMNEIYLHFVCAHMHETI